MHRRPPNHQDRDHTVQSPGYFKHLHAHAIRRRGHGFSATTYKRKSFGSTATCQFLPRLGTQPPSGFMPVLAPSPSCFKTGAIQGNASDGTLHWGDRLRTPFSMANQARRVLAQCESTPADCRQRPPISWCRDAALPRPIFSRHHRIRATEPRANWDLVGGQFLVETASKRYMHIEFVTGNDKSNLDSEYFVLVIQIGASGRQDPSKMY